MVFKKKKSLVVQYMFMYMDLRFLNIKVYKSGFFQSVNGQFKVES